MRSLKFYPQAYESKDNSEAVNLAKLNGTTLDRKGFLQAKNEYKVGMFELMDAMISKLSEVKLDKKKHKINKRLRNKLKEISCFKDSEEDSRVSIDGGTIILEEDEYELLKEHLESATPKVTGRFSGLLDDLLTKVDNAEEYKLSPEEVSPSEANSTG